MLSNAIFAVLTATGSLAFPYLSLRQSSNCSKGLQMFVVRGSTEPQGEGVQSCVVGLVQQSIPGSNGVGIVYPADPNDYFVSEPDGVSALTKAVKSYTQACPTGKFALLGYSQGANVVSDVLGGSFLGAMGPGPIDKSYTKNLAAVITFGDPTHVAGKPYNAGSSTKNGVSPRSNTAALDTYGPIMQSYCDTGDKFCDSGSSLQVHLDEIKNHGPAAASFIVSKFKGSASAGTSGGNETATPTTGTSSPSITCQALVLQTTSLL